MARGTTLYSGGFTATTLKSVTPTSAGFAPVEMITCTTAYYGLIAPNCLYSNGPITTTELSGGVQLNAGWPG